MLRRFAILWIVYTATFAFIAGAVFSWSLRPVQQVQQQQQSEAVAKPDQKGDQQHQAKSLWDRTWEDAVALYTAVLTIFTGLLAVISGIQIGFLIQADKMARRSFIATRRSADAAKKSANVARDTLIVNNRPWVAVGITIGSDLTYDQQGDARVVIVFTLKNVGNSPAANVTVHAEIVPVFGDPIPFQKELSDRAKLRPVGLNIDGVTLFPGETQTHAHNLPISRASMEQFHQKFKTDFGDDIAGRFFPTLVGCIDYKFTFEDGHHQTGFILDLRKRDATNPNLALTFDIAEGTVPANRLWLIQGFIGVPPS